MTLLRVRDIIAALVVVILTRVAYDDPLDSSSATVHLSFYLGRELASGDESGSKVHRLALAPVMLDVDGDGTVEALVAVVHETQTNTWNLEVLDLKPAASSDKVHVAPFRPKRLYVSETIDANSGLNTTINVPLVPVHMITGHVKLKKGEHSNVALSVSRYNNVELNDRNRHYFCGKDWHDAAQSCSTPCPQGTTADCPENQQCYADTPCDVAHYLKQKERHRFAVDATELFVSPAGGLPSIFTLWSNGVLVSHSLLSEAPSNFSSTVNKKNKINPILSLRQTWQISILGSKNIVPYEWSSVSLTFVDSTDAGDGNSGIVVLHAHLTHYSNSEDDELEEEFIIAFDAASGQKLWDASIYSDEYDQKESELLKLPLQKSIQSVGRRRSLKPRVQSKTDNIVANCLHAYRRSFLTSGILPYLYWGEPDAANIAVHFEQQQHNYHDRKKDKVHASSLHGSASKKGKRNWKAAISPFHRKRRGRNALSKPKRGKPNVIVTKNERGIQVRSLKNGRSVCQLSLWSDTLYTDLNHDGMLDSVFEITGSQPAPDDDKYEINKWVSKISTRLREAKMLAEDEQKEKRNEDQVHNLCHLVALSGIPAKEEMFVSNICGNGDSNESIEPAPLLAVESMQGRRKGQDIIVALNNKLVQRVRGTNGRKMWQLNGKHHENFPYWENGHIALLGRINVPNLDSSARPVVLAGDSSVALISPGHGGLLATASFPQPSIRRPILVDFNGDGTTDIVVLTREAVWGYRVTVRTGSSVLFRIAIGLLATCLMLAVLRNRFGPHPGKRSTDS